MSPWLHLVYQAVALIFENRQSPENAFAERFKYDVISSSLLSSAIAATPTTRRTFGSDLPGKLDDASDSTSSDGDKSPAATSSLPEFQVPAALVAVAAIALAAEYYFVAIFLMLAATYSWHSVKACAERATTTASVRAAFVFVLWEDSQLHVDLGRRQSAHPSRQCLGLRCARSHLYH